MASRRRERASTVQNEEQNEEQNEAATQEDQESQEKQDKTFTATVAADETIIDGKMYGAGDEVDLTLADIAQYRRGGVCLTLSEEDERELGRNVRKMERAGSITRY